MLTKRQKDCLEFIQTYHAFSEGKSPTLEEIREGLEVSNKSNVHRLLNSLEERGFIERPKRARANAPFADEIAVARCINVLKSAAPSIPIYDADTLQIRGFIS